MRSCNSRYRLGYTLIEVMIALMVFAIITTISASVMYHVFDIRSRVAQQAKQLEELQLVMTRLQHDATQLIARSVRTPDMQEVAAFVGTYQYMEFTRGGVVNPKAIAKRSELKRVAYLCTKGMLVRRSWEALDTPERNHYEDQPLLQNLATCSFAYVSKYQQIMPQWQATVSQNREAMEVIPSGIQVTLNLPGWGKMTFLLVIPEGLYA